MANKSHPSLGYAAQKAQAYLANIPADPHEAQDTLEKVIVDAMITEANAIRRGLCSKCSSLGRREKPP